MTGTGRTVGIVGLGLIGGSLAQALLARDVQVVATTRSEATRIDAADAGVTVVDDVAAVVGEADLVVLAVPLSVLTAHLVEADGALPAGARCPTITDVGSVKGTIVAAARDLHEPSAFVPGHPMAGTEHAGWEAADPQLFEGRRWALALDEPVAPFRWAEVAALATAVGSEVVPVESSSHDAAVALVSHLPYAVAAAAAALLDGDPDADLARTLAAGSFRDLTRVAGGHPSLGTEMATANGDALRARLGQLADRLRSLADDLGPGSDPAADAVDAFFQAGRQGRTALDRTAAAAPSPSMVRLDRAELLALGRRGGRVTAVRPPTPEAAVLDVTVIDPGPTA